MNEQQLLRYKIGQMLIVGFNGLAVDADSSIVQQIIHSAIGGVILFDYDFTTGKFVKNIASPEQVLSLNKALQRFNNAANEKFSRPDLPLLTSVDYEGGRVDRLKDSYGFFKTQSAQTIGALSIDDAREVALQMANTLKNSGFNLDFAPVVDVNINPDNPVLGKLERCFSDDPVRVAQYANIFADEFLNLGISPAFKHFPGHGSSTKDSHLGFVDVTETWSELEIEPYQHIQAFKNPRSMVMTAHIVNKNLDASGLPATLSKPTLTGLLREKLQFPGVIITDDMQMKAIADNYSLEESLILAINAGVDMFIFGNQLVDEPQDPEEIIDIVVENVRQSAIDVSLIDAAFQRIQRLKLTP